MILARMFWRVRDPVTTGGSGAGTRSLLNSRAFDLILLSMDSTSHCAASILAGSSAYASLSRGEFGAHESCAGGSDRWSSCSTSG